jgi:REP element-mobilizing transposase RayT
MPKPRKALVSLEATPYYHCISRCVRRAFLCGEDSFTGKSFEHRREWIQEKLFELAKVFAIDVAAYAIMSNHYHVVLHIDKERAESWSVQAVIEQWHSLFSGTHLTHRFLKGEAMSQAELLVVSQITKEWRSRLMDISWFMRCLNESVARQANQEDGCTGRFWEGRFKSQALLDEKALAACLAYVDLNPVRAGMAERPESSDFTSLKERALKAQKTTTPDHPSQQHPLLLPFAGNPRQEMPKGLPFRLTDYLELVDWTGRLLRDDKRGAIPNHLPPILERLQIDPNHWLYMAKHFESKFKGLVGSAHKLKAACQKLGYQRTPNIAAAKQLLT